ncbi:aspartate kinase [Alkalihalobacillus alcalophilus ATCC 27647 = CGMCC 1.3604]|uniref:Aspartokinase n=1 Tax=Alkalihalobacillus alcalophilus ATCC 27647 = CGMCC 1.3604 TaxID=1218173 RepID=A0A094WQ28_ALKAL|nr:aspartate kinase [Alkalihalobacillus alcalophilus]KGA98138.1 aspartate kinase [Alkalihalobacillus alcalophilus ATCC 27647 = CGMCC 1.3604]MED1563553.1 aspartate kinase [Alkalihalobacillus alcalophilus]
MARIVQKYGGTSVGTVERIQHVAKRIEQAQRKGEELVVVVSAMGKSTDQLLQLANELTDNPTKREMDMLLSTGEQVTISLLTMALQQRGLEAISFTGWQAGIQTDSHHGNAQIAHIDTVRMEAELRLGKVVIVAGFQGLSEDAQITTLGRGGSDTTAVALAAALDAERCEIYTDVTGVYTTDPRYVKTARKLHSISYDEMLEMAQLGAGVLHPRAVEFAKNYDVALLVASSMVEEEGTLIEEEVSMEKGLIVRGIAFENDVTKVTVAGLPNEMNTLAKLFSTLSRHFINVDIIVQNETDAEHVTISFTVTQSTLKDTLVALEKAQNDLKYENVQYETGLAKVSIVGSGMVSNPGVAAQMFDVLAEEGIAIKMVSTSEIKVSTVVSEDDMVLAVEALHEAFKLAEELVEPAV